MGPYLQAFSAGIKTSLMYRTEILFRTIRHGIILLMFLSLWGAVFRNQQNVNGFSFNQMVTYYLLIEIVDMLYTARIARVISRNIKNGNLSNYLLKPMNFWTYNVFYIIGEQLTTSSLSLIIAFAAFIFVPNLLFVPAEPINLFLFALSAIFAWVLHFQIYFIVGTLSFWFGETDYIRIAVVQVTHILAGRWIPIVFFPILFLSFIQLLPFQYLFDFLIKIFLSTIEINVILRSLLVEMIWIFVLSIIGWQLWKKGLVKYESYGK